MSPHLSEHRPFDLRQYVPLPFAQIEDPLDALGLADIVGTLITQSLGLATTVRFALATPDVQQFHLDDMEESLEILVEYLQQAQAVFARWGQEQGITLRPLPTEEGQR